ncbi:helix-turn-helix domain-containing protein [Pseudonocardia yunnanensis]|uniref:Helix-turn-helix domain-containing protein n=1 Tax=Pseudonocardia yunnanensis TaxID=58107 RepID=A0ABW4FAU6_9PSEU
METETLPVRLRILRQRHWDEPITQPVLGRLLGVKAPTISSWERADGPAVPPPERLAAYATFFASRRSLEADRLLDDAELTASERTDRDALLADLLRLRQQALSSSPADDLDPWVFPDGAPVRIICGRLADPPRTARGQRWNYMALSAYGDLDALVELYGHIRARNPESDVQFELAGRLEGDDLRAHLILLGHLAWRQTDLRHLLPSDFPVRQTGDEGIEDGEIFEVAGTGERFGPVFVVDGDDRRVVEDVGFLARTPSPVDSARTLTVCSGVYTRGVYGAVRCLTDRRHRADNASYLHRRFAQTPTYGVLMRVRGTDHAIGTPRLGDDAVRLYEFPTA